MTTRGVGLSEEERLVEVIEQHAWHIGLGKCTCGWEATYKDAYAEGEEDDEEHQWAIHVAAIVAAHTADLAAQAADAWDEGVDAAFRGAVTRQNGDDVKRRNPYRAEPADPRTHGLNHAPLPEGTLLDPGFCAGCDALRAALSPAQPDTERGGGS